MRDPNKLTSLTRAPTRRQVLAGAAALCGGLRASSLPALVHPGEDVSRTTESIHQQLVFKASPKRVYEALTEAKQFEEVTKLSRAMQSGMPLGDKPTGISREAGGPFVLFGGHIVGRHIELVPNERIVQAWRVVTWDPGVYSVARFALMGQDSVTKLVFDHVGFPDGQGQHLAEGWKVNYWEPLEKYLA